MCKKQREKQLQEQKINTMLPITIASEQLSLNEDEIKTVIDGVLKELEIETPTGKDKGRIMKVLMPKVKGIADGKLVNQVLAGMMQ